MRTPWRRRRCPQPPLDWRLVIATPAGVVMDLPISAVPLVSAGSYQGGNVPLMSVGPPTVFSVEMVPPGGKPSPWPV